MIYICPEHGTGQVARWAFGSQTQKLRTPGADEKAPESPSLNGNEKTYCMAGKHDNKNVRVTVRFTTKEWEEIEVQMKNFDYLSKAHFIRDKVLNKRIKIDRSVELTDRVFRNQINSLSGIVARVGVDYNQATKRFNYLVKQKRADGSPVINSRAANYYLKQLHSMTIEMKQAIDQIINMVAALELKEAPVKEVINNTLKPLTNVTED